MSSERDHQAYTRSLEEQIELYKEQNRILLQYIQDAKEDRKYLFQQLELYREREKLGLLREKRDYQKIVELEQRLRFLPPPEHPQSIEHQPRTRATYRADDVDDEINYDDEETQRIIDEAIYEPIAPDHAQNPASMRPYSIKTRAVRSERPSHAPRASAPQPQQDIPKHAAAGSSVVAAIPEVQASEPPETPEMVEQKEETPNPEMSTHKSTEESQSDSAATASAPPTPKPAEAEPAEAPQPSEPEDSQAHEAETSQDFSTIPPEESPVEKAATEVPPSQEAVTEAAEVSSIESDSQSEASQESEPAQDAEESPAQIEEPQSTEPSAPIRTGDEPAKPSASVEPSQSEDEKNALINESFKAALEASVQKEYDKAIELFALVTELLPTASPSFLNLGILYFRKGRLEEALRAAQRAAELGSEPAGKLINRIEKEMGIDSAIRL